ncbi:hypothetical protein GCM10007385_14990 [Tateyamaria omphalii]|uniref:DUF4329 domain-containing protein n=1 Tax=Tateyamaria omphalii TaxID=299262 RepID=UPI00167986C0|nr:DUF4329 domain-containing protein [Tateyamaria omphalii]GGX48167.1 hypothetical protein GCM10007385_14990 [Tateyamaria omphalii]
MLRRLGLFLFALAACDDAELGGDPATIVMAPRPFAQTEAEIAFAADLFNGLQAQSIDEGREYCGLIGVDADGAYVATTARRGGKATCLPPASAGANVTVLASYHTHGHYKPAFLTEIPSYDDIRTDIEDGTDGYVATPGGRLWYIDARAQEARLICGTRCLVSDADFQEDPAFPVFPRYTLQDLRSF